MNMIEAKLWLSCDNGPSTTLVRLKYDLDAKSLKVGHEESSSKVELECEVLRNPLNFSAGDVVQGAHDRKFLLIR